MIEKKLGKQLRGAVYWALALIVIFIVCGGALSAYLYKTREEVTRNQVIAEAEEYKKRILKQFESDSRLLRTFADLISLKDNNDLLIEEIDKFKADNQFLTILYYNTNGQGIISNMDEDTISGADLNAVAPEARQSILLALEKGEESVSRLFESNISQTRVFVYTVPVYRNGEIIGALSASDHIEIFSEILSGDTVLGGGGYIHLIGSQGRFLIKSPKMIVKENIPTIFDGAYLSDSEKETVMTALTNQERLFSHFKNNGSSYLFLLEPIGINGWYLLCVNTGEGLAANTHASALVTQITFLGIFILIIVLMLRGYRLLRNYSRDLLGYAYHDQLTGAENLLRFRQRLYEALNNGGGSVAALSIRQFPFINEIFGRERADKLLCLIKEKADCHLTQGEFFCRDTMDSFYLFFRDTEEDLLKKRIEEFMEDVCRNTDISHTDYRLALYCGVASTTEVKDSEGAAEALMTHVQFALSSAKGHHDSSIWFFDSELHKTEELENYIESHMHSALEDGEFKMFLQPKKNLDTNRIEGAEALVRWHTPQGRQIFPDSFIPLFEKNGFCLKLDMYMVEQACKQIRSWTERGIEPIAISVNQSKLLFFEENYISMLKDTLKKYNVPAGLITLEILEGLALENEDILNERITALQAEGFKISLDDFGSGYSSLNTLGKLKINELKLDRDFLLKASGENSQRVRLIMEYIVKLAETLGISTVAEGVETTEDEEFIKSIGCKTGQGYLYSKPISAAEFDEKYMSRD